MAGFTDFLFGNKGGLETQQVPRWDPNQQAIWGQLAGRIQAGMSSPWGPGNMTPQTRDYLNLITTGYEPWARQVSSGAFNPAATRSVYENFIMPEFEKYGAPAIKQQYAGPGYWGSTRADAVGRGYSDLYTQFGNEMYGMDKARSSAYATLMGNQPTMMAEGAKVAENYQPWMNPWLQMAYQELGLQPFDTIAGMRQPAPGFVTSLASGAGEMAGMYGGAKLFGLIK